MNAIRIALAVVALGVSSLTFAAGVFEGGSATGLTFEPTVTGATRVRSEVAAEGRAALRTMDSRSGEQTDAEQNAGIRVTSTRSRDEVRSEAIAASHGRQPIFEGGESASAGFERADRAQPSATVAAVVVADLN